MDGFDIGSYGVGSGSARRGTNLLWDGAVCGTRSRWWGSPDTGWENSKACTLQGASCNASCAGGCEISNGCSGGSGGTCFLPGTKVETAEGSKNIETMSVGDQVKSFDSKDKVVNASVSDVMKFSRDYYYELEAGDYSVKVTAEHPFYFREPARG